MKQFEQPVLRQMLGPVRARLEAPTRRPKERQKTLKLTFARPGLPGTSDIISREVIVPAGEFPVLFIGPLLYPPGILKGWEPREGEAVESTMRIDNAVRDKFRPEEGERLYLGQINPLLYARELAKIAYSYAVAERGYGSFKESILPLIRGEVSTFTHWVGGDHDIPAPSEEVHRLQSSIFDAGVARFLFVTIRLFGYLGTPNYHVVVGEV